ncbi:MAG: MtrB/PioB family decaheme-associated outer membrane protein [Pseudomonadota bacterium]
MKAFERKLIPAAAGALLAVFGVAALADEDPALTSSVEAGIANVSRDNQRFGQYSGLNDKGAYLLLDAYINRRYDDTGTWLRFTGRNLGLDSRELRFEHNRQGNWGYFIDFSQTPRHDPYTVTTRLTGIGTANQTILGSATMQEYRLKTERKAWTFGFDKSLLPGLGLQVRFRNEDKEGSRLFGQGTFGSFRFLTDPIDYNTKQLEATLNYSTPRLQLSGGYYGTWFRNSNLALNIGGSIAGFTPAALPPGNDSHQVNLALAYRFTSAIRGNFKFARARATQDDAFPVAPLAGLPSNLQARVDTTLLQAGLTARATPNLTLRADLRYHDRDDKTPVLVYYPSQAAGASTNAGVNEPRSIRTTSGKLEASYRLPMGLRLTGGVDYEEKKRNSPPVRAVDFREKTDETTLRAELRRSMSETLTGALGVLHGRRRGSDWLPMVAFNGTATSAAIAPLHLIDRDRDTLRLTLDWMPLERLQLGFRVDGSRDKYTGRGINAFDIGPKKGTGTNFSLDAAYAFSEGVSGTAWYQRNENRYDQTMCQTNAADVCTNSAANPVWGSSLKNISDTWGLGLRAKVSARLELRADFTDADVRDELGTSLISPAGSTTVTPLPNINTRVTTFKLAGDYALSRQSTLRLFYVYDRYRTDDWTWANWNYTTATDGGTTVRESPNQKVNFIGVSYRYRFQ